MLDYSSRVGILADFCNEGWHWLPEQVGISGDGFLGVRSRNEVTRRRESSSSGGVLMLRLSFSRGVHSSERIPSSLGIVLMLRFSRDVQSTEWDPSSLGIVLMLSLRLGLTRAM